MELITFAVPGKSYPAAIPGNDLAFQHLAIVVSDIEAAYARLRRIGLWRDENPVAPWEFRAKK